jgi:cytochrome c oxidase cbb3-type subunit I
MMSAATTAPATAPNTGTQVYAQPSPMEIDLSCRKALMLLFTHSIFWLVFGLLLSVIASIKLHGPGMFASMPGLTYGRVSAAASSSYLYGFASQAGIAIALWLLCRLGRTFLVFSGGIIVGALLWNFGVLVGVLGIFYGNTTGFDRFEMPLYIAPVLFVAYALMGISGLLTYHTRTESDTYPSTWYILAAFFVFPWIYSTAALLLGPYAVRGPMQPIVATWFGNNFIAMWLAPLALAVLFYFASKLSQQPLFSYGTAVFGFWGYVLLAHASGFQNLHVAPNWMPALSTVINLFLMPIVVLAITYNLYKTWSGHGTKLKEKSPEAKYIAFAALSFVVAGAVTALSSIRKIEYIVGYTVFQFGLAQLVIFGFIGMAFFGAMVHILPRLTEIDWPITKFTRMHYSASVLGIGLGVVALLIGGFIHGNMLNDTKVSSIQAIRRTIPFIGISTLGLIIFLAAQVLLLANFAAMVKACCAGCCGIGKEANR